MMTTSKNLLGTQIMCAVCALLFSTVTMLSAVAPAYNVPVAGQNFGSYTA